MGPILRPRVNNATHKATEGIMDFALIVGVRAVEFCPFARRVYLFDVKFREKHDALIAGPSNGHTRFRIKLTPTENYRLEKKIYVHMYILKKTQFQSYSEASRSTKTGFFGIGIIITV